MVLFIPNCQGQGLWVRPHSLSPRVTRLCTWRTWPPSLPKGFWRELGHHTITGSVAMGWTGYGSHWRPIVFSFIVHTPFSVLNIITVASLQFVIFQLLYFLEKLIDSISQCDRKSLTSDSASFDQHILMQNLCIKGAPFFTVRSVFHPASKISSHDTASEMCILSPKPGVLLPDLALGMILTPFLPFSHQ